MRRRNAAPNLMISLKRFLEPRRRETQAANDVTEASMQMCRLLLDAISIHVVRGREADFKAFGRTMKQLLRRMDEPPSAFNLLEISSGASEALETYVQQTSDYFREQTEQMQSMVAMLTDTLADISGQTDNSIARLQLIEQQIERASGLEDMRMLSASLESCLSAVREAAAQQKKGSAATVKRLQENINVAQTRIDSRPAVVRKPVEIELAPEPEVEEEPPEVSPIPYVAAFKLQRADHITARFGVSARNQMLSLVSQTLKTLLGPGDRLLRWKGTSFVMFLNSAANINEVRVLLTNAVARTGQHYIEVGKKTALISVGVDWIVFPQSQCTSLDAVFTEVDSFLTAETTLNAPNTEVFK